MPYTPAQHRLFEAAAHDKTIATQHGMSQTKAAEMAHEAIKHDPKKIAKQLRKK